MEHLKAKIRHVPDFPNPGILFYDITTLRNPQGSAIPLTPSPRRPWARTSTRSWASNPRLHSRRRRHRHARLRLRPRPQAREAAGRDAQQCYSLEYGSNALEIHTDACAADQRVLIVDDVLATGGPATATVDLARQAGGKVIGVAFLIELDFLNGRDKLTGEPVYSVLQY